MCDFYVSLSYRILLSNMMCIITAIKGLLKHDADDDDDDDDNADLHGTIVP